MSRHTSLTVAISLLASLILVDTAAAYYSPSMGRFLNRDPIVEPGAVLVRQAARPARSFIPRDNPLSNDGKNAFEFVVNSPVNLVDALGLQAGNPPKGMPHCKHQGQFATFLFDALTLSGHGHSYEAVAGRPIVTVKWDHSDWFNDWFLKTYPSGCINSDGFDSEGTARRGVFALTIAASPHHLW